MLNADTERGRALLLGGLALGSLGGLDTAAREHFAGYRSHSMVLAGVPAVGIAAILYFTGLPWPVVTAAAILTFALAVWRLAKSYEHRAA